MNAKLVFILALAVAGVFSEEPCQKASSRVTGKDNICRGDLLFSDDFDTFEIGTKWLHENTLGGGGNWEFQWYTNNRSNSFVKNGVLHLKPTLVSDQMGEGALSSATLDINGGSPADECTNPAFWGCIRTGNPVNILNPIKSARIRTVESFHFTYGHVQARAKLPRGDWLWPAIWMMPRHNQYGTWPSSGEIDIMESRGNDDLVQNGNNIGNKQASSTLHWGPDYFTNQYWRTGGHQQNSAGFNSDFHLYELIWTPDSIEFLIDGQRTTYIAPPAGGFWELGELGNKGIANPWVGASKMAPFDQDFYLIINLAVGGTNHFFPDDSTNPRPKPWSNTSPQAFLDFWNGRNDYLPTWNIYNSDDSALQVDYIKVYAV